MTIQSFHFEVGCFPARDENPSERVSSLKKERAPTEKILQLKTVEKRKENEDGGDASPEYRLKAYSSSTA